MSAELQAALANYSSMQQNQIVLENDLKSQIQSLTSSKDCLQEALDKMGQQSSNYQQESEHKINSLQSQLHETQTQIETLNSELASKQQEYEQLKNEANSKQCEYDAKHAEISEYIKKLESEKAEFTRQVSQYNEEISRLSQSENEYKNQAKTLSDQCGKSRSALIGLEHQNANLTSLMEQNQHEYAKNVSILSQQLQQEKENCAQLNSQIASVTPVLEEHRMCGQLMQAKQSENAEILKKLRDFEYLINQKTTEVNQLRADNAAHVKIQEESKVLQLRMKQIEDSYKAENATQVKTFKKKKEDMDAEIDELKNKVKLLMGSEKSLNSRLTEKVAELNSYQGLLDKELENAKGQISKLTCELETVKKEKSDICSQFKSVTEFNKKFEAHYEEKKKQFKEKEDECRKLEWAIKKSDEEKSTLEVTCSRLESSLSNAHNLAI